MSANVIRVDDWLEALRAATAKNDGGSTTEELCEALGLSDRTVLKRIRQAHKKGWVTVGRRSVVRIDGKPDAVPTYTITVPKEEAVNKLELVVDGSSGALDLEAFIAGKMSSAFAIFKERQAKYGSGNIARRGPVGVLVRLDDKLARLDRVFMEGAADAATDESVEDTCLDIANYALILLACHAGRWPGWTPKRPEGTGPGSPPAGYGPGVVGQPPGAWVRNQSPQGSWTWADKENVPTTP